MYTRQHFGKELKEKICHKQPIAEIGHWTYSVYLEHIEDIDLAFRDILLTLNTMEDGPEFSFSYEELDKIADDLIFGREARL